MSNFHLTLLVGVALLLVIVFGHNPMDEVRKKKAERAGITLVKKIEEANKKNKTNRQQMQPNFSGKPGIANAQSPGQIGNTPFTQQPNRPTVAPKDEYYPPAPKNPNVKIPLSSRQDPNGELIAKKLFQNPNLITDDGKTLAFWGAKVYTYDNKGKIQLLPDGKYAMYDGKWTMNIRGGEQFIVKQDIFNSTYQ